MDHRSTVPIRIAIVGHGNLGRGVEAAIARNPDMALAGIYTRRDPESLQPLQAGTPVHGMDGLLAHRAGIDVLVLCGGSKDDLPRQAPELAAHFSLVDSFDTHARIPEHFDRVDAAARAGGTTALVSAGWDPGLFSLQRLMGEALLPDGTTYTFWGKGLSQGHSDAIRRIPGVAGGVQYTIPVDDAVQQVRSGVRPELSARERHGRECFVVLQEGADAQAVRAAIVGMPHYFDEYDTTVHSSAQKNWPATTRPCRTAASSFAAAAARRGTGMPSSTGCNWTAIRNSRPACSWHARGPCTGCSNRVRRAARPCSMCRPGCCRPGVQPNCAPHCYRPPAAGSAPAHAGRILQPVHVAQRLEQGHPAADHAQRAQAAHHGGGHGTQPGGAGAGAELAQLVG
jgi:diaminopimelate dehydrogenase